MSAGKDNFFYVQIGGTYATPTWVRGFRVHNVKRPASRNASNRMFRGLTTVLAIGGYKVYAFTFTYIPAAPESPLYAADLVFASLEASFESETPMDCLFLNQDVATTGAKGVRAPLQCFKFDRNEDDEDNVSYDVELRPVEADDGSGGLLEVEPFTVP